MAVVSDRRPAYLQTIPPAPREVLVRVLAVAETVDIGGTLYVRVRVQETLDHVAADGAMHPNREGMVLVLVSAPTWTVLRSGRLVALDGRNVEWEPEEEDPRGR